MATMMCSAPLLKNMRSRDADSSVVAAAAAMSILLRGSSPPAIADYFGLWDGVGSRRNQKGQQRARDVTSGKAALVGAVARPVQCSTDLPANILNRLKGFRIGGMADGTGGSVTVAQADRKQTSATCPKPRASCCKTSGSASGGNAPGSRKRVTFADHKGLDLEAVRLFHESSDSPPQVSAGMASAAAAAAAAAAASAASKLLFRVDSKQPVADYASFRERLSRQNVSVENVTVVDGSRIVTTVKVKNLSFEKHVFARVTADNWHSFKDLPAHYVAGVGSEAPGGDANGCAYDTFIAEADIIAEFPNVSVFRPLEFAVCYESQGVQYWDNNDGHNYRLVSDHALAPALQEVPHQQQQKDVADQRWSDYAAWRYLEEDIPYW